MALSVLYLGGWPQAATITNASTFTFTNGISTTQAGSYIAGYVDGENRAKYFYTDGSTVTLPTLTQVKQVSIVDAAGNTKTGAYYVTLGGWSSTSPDSSSANSEIFLDASGLLLKASTAYG
jgi:hypothetical protein